MWSSFGWNVCPTSIQYRGILAKLGLLVKLYYVCELERVHPVPLDCCGVGYSENAGSIIVFLYAPMCWQCVHLNTVDKPEIVVVLFFAKKKKNT